MKHLLTRLAVVALLLSSLTVGADDVLASGGAVKVTQSQLDEAFIALRAAMAATGRPFPENQRALIEKQLVSRLALSQVLMNRANDEDRRTGTEKAKKILLEQKARARSEESYEMAVRASGLTPERFEEQLVERAITEQVLEREVRPLLAVKEEDIRKYYDENPAQFEQPEHARAAHILISTRDPATRQDYPEAVRKEKRELADRLLMRAKDGEDFSTLVREYSDDLGSKDNNGEYTFTRGQMAPEFEVAAYALEPGGLSAVVTTQYGYHIIKLIEKKSGEKVSYDAVKERIRASLELHELQRRLPEFEKKLLTDAGVTFAGAN